MSNIVRSLVLSTHEYSTESPKSPLGGDLEGLVCDQVSSTRLVTSRFGNFYQRMEYFPFGELMYEERLEQYGVPYLFGAKELDDESGFNYFSDRYYHPKLAIFNTMDRLWDVQPWQNPYVYCSNNPINRVDPTGMLDWEPEVSSSGKTSYKAEQGDNYQSFKSQYGLSDKQASQIFSQNGFSTTDDIAKGSEISGETVQKVTGSEILKLNWSSSQVTDQRKADQIMFAIKHSQMNYTGDPIVDMKDYNTNFQIGQGGINFSNITISVGDGRIPIKNMSIGFTYENTQLMNSGQEIRQIPGTTDMKHVYYSGASFSNPKSNRPMMNLRFDSKYTDRYSKYYH